MIIQDGETYKNKEELPDLGTIECIRVEEGNVRHYQCYARDVEKLKQNVTYDSLGAGSTCIVLDNDDVFMYHAGTKTWN